MPRALRDIELNFRVYDGMVVSLDIDLWRIK
jgi:hypothetical protein